LLQWFSVTYWKKEIKMTEFYHRHDISDLEPHLLGRAGGWGRIAHDNRRFFNGVLWILRTGAPWRDLPADYGDWKEYPSGFLPLA